MPDLPSAFNQYPLIGSNDTIIGDYIVQRRYDGINATEMLNYIFKKQFGIPNAYPYNTYDDDTLQRVSAINNSTLDKQYSQYIPYQPPTDKIQDTTFDNSKYGNTGERYISSNYPYMAYYTNMQMSYISDYSFFVGYNNDDGTTFYLTQNAISPFYGRDPTFDPQTYFKELLVYDSAGNPLEFGIPSAGNWILDCDSGILTFYDDTPNVTATNPPIISFWRYEGLIGNNTIMNVKDF